MVCPTFWRIRNLQRSPSDPSRHARSHRPGRRHPARAAASSHFRPRPSTASAPTPPTGCAVAAIFAAKGRPRFNPLIVHVPESKPLSALAPCDAIGATAGRRVLAGGADAGAGKAVRIASSPSWPPPGSTPSPCACRAHPDRPGPAAGRRPAHRRAQRQPLRPCQPDHRGARRGRPRRPRGHDPRRRRHARRPGIDRRRRDRRRRRSSCASAASRARTSNACSGRPSPWPASENVQAVLARHAGAALRARHPAAARCARRARGRGAAGLRRARARSMRPDDQPQPLRRSRRGRRQPVRRPAHARCRGRHGHCRHADPGRRAWAKPSTTGCGAPREPQ